MDGPFHLWLILFRVSRARKQEVYLFTILPALEDCVERSWNSSSGSVTAMNHRYGWFPLVSNRLFTDVSRLNQCSVQAWLYLFYMVYNWCMIYLPHLIMYQPPNISTDVCIPFRVPLNPCSVDRCSSYVELALWLLLPYLFNEEHVSVRHRCVTI